MLRGRIVSRHLRRKDLPDYPTVAEWPYHRRLRGGYSLNEGAISSRAQPDRWNHVMRVIDARGAERKDANRSAKEIDKIAVKPSTMLIATGLSTISGKQSWSSAVINTIQSRRSSIRCISST